MYREVHLHGALKEKFGGPYRFEIDTPAEAIRALSANFRGFESTMSEGEYQLFRGPLNDERDFDVDELHLRFGRHRELHIVPVVGGAKRGGTGKAIIGAVIMIAAIAMAPFTGGASLVPATIEATAATAVGGTIGAVAGGGLGATAFTLFGASITYGNIALFGLSMMVSGIGQMLSPQPKSSSFEPVDRKPSFMFTGALNASTQGNAVPVVYGRIRVGSVVISAGVEAIEIT